MVVEVVKEIEFPERMNWELAEKWADGILTYSENDPNNPEWRATRVIPADLTKEGYGFVYVKDESDRCSNPTGTVKDRMAWELTTLYRDFARSLILKKSEVDGKVSKIVIPRFTCITAGNVGKAVSDSFDRYGLPSIKLLVDSSIDKTRLNWLRELHADVYLVDLNREQLTPEQIRLLTNNVGGIDITSTTFFEPQAVFYDWQCHEVFNEAPSEVFIPYGSGRLFENYLTWQTRNARARDPRLRIPLEKLVGINIFGAQPKEKRSLADKLSTTYNPFIFYDGFDVAGARSLAFTGSETGVYQVEEESILEAYNILKQFCETEPSASAGLALYIEKFKQRKIKPNSKTLVVNTGCGI